MNQNFNPNIIIDPFSILVVNAKGELKRIHCPFLARCMIPIGRLELHRVYSVEMVKVEVTENIYFIIRGIEYSHHRFLIVL